MFRKSFQESFQRFIGERMEVIGTDICDNPKYKELQQKQIDLFDKIVALLEPEGKALMFEFDSAGGEMQSLHFGHAYKSGFKEALGFKSMIDSASIPFIKEVSLNNLFAN